VLLPSLQCVYRSGGCQKCQGASDRYFLSEPHHIQPHTGEWDLMDFALARDSRFIIDVTVTIGLSTVVVC
jgi:hypothetical protein